MQQHEGTRKIALSALAPNLEASEDQHACMPQQACSAQRTHPCPATHIVHCKTEQGCRSTTHGQSTEPFKCSMSLAAPWSLHLVLKQLDAWAVDEPRPHLGCQNQSHRNRPQACLASSNKSCTAYSVKHCAHAHVVQQAGLLWQNQVPAIFLPWNSHIRALQPCLEQGRHSAS